MERIFTLLFIVCTLGLFSCGNNRTNRPVQTVVHSTRIDNAVSSAETIIQWRGTDRSGVYHEEGLMTSWESNVPELLWHFDGLEDGHSSPAIADGKIYLTGMANGKGFIYVFDLNGKLLNKKEYGREWDRNYDGSRGTVTINDEKLYLISGLGVLYCFNKNSLNLIWEKNLLQTFNAPNIRWGIAESPLIIGDKVIATPGGRQYNMVALNKNTGELIWSTPAMGDQSAYCSPIFIDDQEVPLIVTMTANHIIGVNADTGEILWSHPNSNRWSVHANSPVYGDNMILVTSGYGRGSTMLRLTNGGRSVQQAWFNENLDNRIGGMVKVGNYVYGSGDNNRFWFCVDWQTGEIKWQERGLAMGVIIANKDMLYLYTDRGDMILARATPEKFDIVGRFSITLGTNQHWAHPVIYNGILYVRRGDTIMAYNIKV
ncbi:MAG: PQQ-binding-like beta-propeller repeat protein [Dysgonamonadaceae bacterium]|nr:PQQ-binding-like beta-propeller repeat protein [Dysgonamonadaceae bacterium]